MVVLHLLLVPSVVVSNMTSERLQASHLLVMLGHEAARVPVTTAS